MISMFEAAYWRSANAHLLSGLCGKLGFNSVRRSGIEFLKNPEVLCSPHAPATKTTMILIYVHGWLIDCS